MGLLRVLGLVLVNARAFRQVIVAIAVANRSARSLDRFRRHVDPVSPHIGNVTGLIEALRRAHGLTRAHAEFAARFLLKR